MIRNPIRKVLSAMRLWNVRSLLMGGQACILYGAAEFSRDTDLVVLAEEDNYRRLMSAMSELRAEQIAVPPAELDYLRRGHAIHFRCRHADVDGLRVDVMARLRGVQDFETLWARRTTLRLEDDLDVDLLALPDLVQAKKTQRDKDWPMIRRLLEVDYLRDRRQATATQAEFWLLELRTPSLLVECACEWPVVASQVASVRPLVRGAMEGGAERLTEALLREELEERQRDQDYWVPLRRELEALRHA